MNPRGRRLRAAVSVAFVLGCGRGGDIDLGRVRQPADGGRGGAGPASCGAAPCADLEGTKVFIDADAPRELPELFDTATRHPPGSDPGREPAIVYPSHETRFPINVAHILHEWTETTPGAWFELSFEGPRTLVRIYTSSLRFTPTDEQWDWIAESNRGGEVELSIAALEPGAPGDAWTSASVSLGFSDAAVEGAIYYWSTGTEGIMKALVHETSPVKFYAEPAAEKAPCVGCHSLSKDGTRLAMSYENESLREISVVDRSVILPVASGSAGAGGAAAMPPAKMDPVDPKAGTGSPAGWTTFSPDGKLLLVAAGGVLTLRDADTGEPVGGNGGVVPMPDGVVPTHPDWSALGDRVALTFAEKGGDKDVERGSIAVLPYDRGVWGTPEIVVANRGGDDNNYFPAFSPDSRFLAYVNGSGKSNDARYAELRLLRLEDRAVFPLTRLNQRVGPLDGVQSIGNSMPTWAPSTRPGVFWLAFSSVRAYASLRGPDDKKDQIWLSAIDGSLPEPSFSAFWAPFQNIAHGNHRAFWTHTDEDRQCLCVDVCGDSIDNDCDGRADEPECLPSCAPSEVCGDGIDNDCNCVVDDCMAEICDDGIDNDGDEFADAEDPSCAP